MKKFLFMPILLLMLLLPVSCTQKQIDYTVDVAEINSEYNLLSMRYEKIKQLVLSKWEMFDEADQQTLEDIDDNVSRIQKKINEFRSVQFYQMTPTEMGYLYTLASESYFMAKDLYLKYENKLTTSEALTFQMFDDNLSDLDKSVKEFIENPDNVDLNTILANIMSVTSTGLKIILPMFL